MKRRTIAHGSIPPSRTRIKEAKEEKTLAKDSPRLSKLSKLKPREQRSVGRQRRHSKDATPVTQEEGRAVRKEAITLHLPKPHTSTSLASLDRLSRVLVHWARCAHLWQHHNTCVAQHVRRNSE